MSLEESCFGLQRPREPEGRGNLQPPPPPVKSEEATATVGTAATNDYCEAINGRSPAELGLVGHSGSH
jgi:hypothetical protein